MGQNDDEIKKLLHILVENKSNKLNFFKKLYPIKKPDLNRFLKEIEDLKNEFDEE